MVLNARLSTIHPYYSADIATKPIRALLTPQNYDNFLKLLYFASKNQSAARVATMKRKLSANVLATG